MVVALWQGAEFLAETFVAGVVFAGCAIAVAAPVAERFGNFFEFGVISEYGSAFAHGDVVGRVETECADVAKGADQFAVVGGTERVATVFDQPQIMLFAQCYDHVQVVRIAQGVGQHDGFCLAADSGFDLAGINVVGAQFDIDEYRHSAKLQDRVDGGGETCGDANDFIARLDRTVAQLGRGQCVECDQICG